MISIARSESNTLFAETVFRVVSEHAAPYSISPTPELWRAPGDSGFLGVCTAEIGGSATDLLAAMETLGRVGCPGPLVAAQVATQLFTGDLLTEVSHGTSFVTITNGSYAPWATISRIKVEISDGRAWLVEPLAGLKQVATLSGETWSTGRFKRTQEFENVERATVLGDIALSSYLIGAALELTQVAADHAKSRRQFGRPISEFQAVAHPLARSFSELTAASRLLIILGLEFDQQTLQRQQTGPIRQHIARMTCQAAERSHQVFGAMGFASESGIGTRSARIRQWACLPPLI